VEIEQKKSKEVKKKSVRLHFLHQYLRFLSLQRICIYLILSHFKCKTFWGCQREQTRRQMMSTRQLASSLCFEMAGFT